MSTCTHSGGAGSRNDGSRPHDVQSKGWPDRRRALPRQTGPAPSRNMYSMLTPQVTELIRHGQSVTEPLRPRVTVTLRDAVAREEIRRVAPRRAG